ncbi:SGNH hydrolase [Microthyrium microscopicum]|uniref:SGNH hydrolase n=1 Tax=Microthyrium microscopicum TaxID=703497 RepID=A0A6A6UE27_9PEZI|nr:SGNH hydrolase [Microthyrium microscopicum]
MAPKQLTLANVDQISILAFGDSLTEGHTDFGLTTHPYGPALQNKLSELLPGTEITVDVNGLGGDRVLLSLAGSFQQRLKSALSEKDTPYDIVVILGGTNDLGYKLSDDCAGEICEGLKALHDEVLISGASVVCVTVPERALDRTMSSAYEKARKSRIKLNEKIAEHAKDYSKIFLMDLAPLCPHIEEDGEEPLWSLDGLHMTTEGYDFFGEELAKFIFTLF